MGHFSPVNGLICGFIVRLDQKIYPMRIYLFLLLSPFMMAQEQQLPLYEIPPAPSVLSPGDLIARMIQGLGYRFYWASNDLVPKDLAYRPSDGAASSLETLQHIYSLSLLIRKTAASKPFNRRLEKIPNDYKVLRKNILIHLDESAQLFSGKNAEQLQKMQVVFEREEGMSRFPIWNFLNGPLSDAIYHTGQLVSFRRTTGNPIQKGVNVFLGKTKDLSPPSGD